MENRYVGYIVNVYNPLNFQIDLHKEIENVYSGVYYYKENNETVKGTFYRCRLKNVKLRTTEGRMYNNLFNEINKKVYICNGWVIVKSYYIDKYQRLIVDLFDPITNENYIDIMKDYNIIEKI